jgi:type IV pilus secretin PilQ/predicted competence protein
MRIMWRAWGLGAVLAASLILTNGAVSASDIPVVHLKAVVKDGAVVLEAEANGPFEYTTYRPSESLFVVDLTGVSAGDPVGAQVVASDLVKGYRVITYSSGSKPVVRLEVLLSQGLEPQLERKNADDLTLSVSRASSAKALAPAGELSNAVEVPASAKASDMKIATAGSAAIRQVNLGQNAGETQVSISGSGPLSYHAQRLQNPDRLVLDFSGSHLSTSEHHIPSNLDPVREIRLGQFSADISRVVIDLREPAPYQISADGDTVKVSFAAGSKPSGSAKPAQAEAPSANTMTTQATIAERPSAAARPAVVRTTTASSASVPPPASVLPVALTSSSQALARPVSSVSSGQGNQAREPQEVAANIASPNIATPNIATTNAAANPALASVAAPSSAAPAPATADQTSPVTSGPGQMSSTGLRYTGEPISVNLKDVDLRDFFRLIHEISGLNVVVDPAVKGTLTIVLDNVPWDQALDIVLRNNDLDKQLDGNVLRIATKETLQKEAEENRDLAKAQAEAADVVTTTRVLSYAKASTLVTTLKKFLSSRGDIIADDRSNTLIIRDIPSTLPVLDNLLRQLDQKSQQVEIEARVVAANRSFSRDIGTQFGFAGANPSGSNIFSGTSTVGTSPVVRNFPPLPAPPVVVGSGGASSTSGSIPLLTNLGAAVPTSGIAYSFSSANVALDMIITAAEQKGVGKLLSKPKIITQNNQKATVKQGTKIPVQTIVNNTVSVQFVDAVLELDVTPQITADGTVYMDVTVENDQIDQAIPRVQGIPAIDTQSAETKVTVNDGATVVIGGIIVTQQSTTIQQVPLVGSVPVLGNLFKHTTVSSTSQELLFFLTPRILPS